MGWLFAVGRGLHTGERRAVFHALPPIALGHFLSIAGVALLAGGAGFFLDVRIVRWVCAGLLMTFGVLLLARKIRHRWFGMQVGFGGLTGWSFLMASAHGAGLMVVPALLSLPTVAMVCQVGSERIDAYDVSIDIRRDGSISVTEQIAYDFGSTEHHGIFRTIPVRFHYDDRNDRVYRLHVLSVAGSPGTPDQYKVSKSGNDLEIKVGDPDRTITGRHTYTLA